MTNRQLGNYEKIVNRYLAEVRPYARKEMLFFQRMPSLKSAVSAAAMCTLPNSKRHPHQYRIPGLSLTQAREILLRVDFSTCHSFEDIHQRVDSAIRDIYMIGILTIYDISHRIGAFLRLEPEHIYLHRGVIDGAKALGLPTEKGKLAVHELPAPFQKLKAYEIEDCLCIYKQELAGIEFGTPGKCIQQSHLRRSCGYITRDKRTKRVRLD